MAIVNGILRGVFDVVLYPFKGLHPMVGLAILAVPVSAAMLLVFKKTSNQRRLAAIKSQITAGLFEIRLFNDDLRAIFRAQFEILAQNLKYLGHSLVPLVWMIVPFVLLIGQLQFIYGYEPLRPGDRAVLTVKLADDWRARGSVPTNGDSGRPQVELEVPAGLTLESPPVWAPSINEVAWRLGVEEWGDYQLGVQVGGESFSKSVRVTDDIVRLAPVRVSSNLTEQVLYPAEAPLPKGSPITAISVTYPPGSMVMELSVWVWAFFGLTIVLAFAMRGAFGVTI